MLKSQKASSPRTPLGDLTAFRQASQLVELSLLKKPFPPRPSLKNFHIRHWGREKEKEGKKKERGKKGVKEEEEEERKGVNGRGMEDFAPRKKDSRHLCMLYRLRCMCCTCMNGGRSSAANQLLSYGGVYARTDYDTNYCNNTQATQATQAITPYATVLDSISSYTGMQCDYNSPPPPPPPLFSPDCRVSQSALKSKVRRAVTSSMTSSPPSTNHDTCSYYKKQARCYDVSYDQAAVTSSSAQGGRGYTVV